MLRSSLLALWLVRHSERGVNQRARRRRRIADGDLSPPRQKPCRTASSQQLQDAFITMAANLRETHDALDRQIEQERRMREELQSLQRQVIRQERLAAIGVLVSGVAHELNNPLQAILGTAELLERAAGSQPRRSKRSRFIKTQSRRAREIIRNLSRFSSQQTGPPALVDLRDVVTAVVQLRQRDLETWRSRSTSSITTTRRCYANFTELQQVVLNFVINAQQAIEAGRPHRRAASSSASSTPGKGAARSAGRWARRGARGRTEAVPAVLHDQAGRQGHRLGLSVSYGIIESYGGDDRLSRERLGRRHVLLRAARRPSPRPGRPRPDGAPTPGQPDDRPPLLHRPYLQAFDATVERVEPRGGRIARHARSHRLLSDVRRPAVRHRDARTARVVDVVDEEDGTIAHVDST